MTIPADILADAQTLLLRLTMISSPSGDSAGLERCCAELAAAAVRVGLSAEIEHRPGIGGTPLPVLLARSGAPGRASLLIVGHSDTVLEASAPRFEGERLVATGSVDMKAGLVAFLAALALLRRRGIEVAKDLLLLVVPDEEVAGVLSQQLLAEHGAGARGLWVLEPGEARGQGETVVIGRRGMFHWSVDFFGRSAHAGNAFWHGRSAIFAAAELTARFESCARSGQGPTINPARIVGGERDFVDSLKAHADLLGSLRQINVVPDRARLEGEARFLTVADDRALRIELARHATEVAALRELEVKLEVSESIPPLDPRGKSRDLATRAQTAAARLGFELAAEEERGGISFPNFLPDPAALPILDGLGPTGGGMHTREEWVDLRSFERRIALLAELLAEDAGP
jgi:glutamate carboxypeptidase